MDEMTRQNKANNLKIEHEELAEMLMGKKGTGAGWAVPKIIYASRTHSQLSQAMQELKRSGYSHVKAAVIGSRDQLCIHPDVVKETTNANKIHMCKLKVTTRTCSYHQRVESSKEAPQFRNAGVLDIEDLVTAGRKLKCCPYFVSRELIPDADIVFMPYNYLLDPMARKANKVELNNTIVILDEAHNVEKICEESASVQLASSEVAVCIDELTHVRLFIFGGEFLYEVKAFLSSHIGSQSNGGESRHGRRRPGFHPGRRGSSEGNDAESGGDDRSHRNSGHLGWADISGRIHI